MRVVLLMLAALILPALTVCCSSAEKGQAAPERDAKPETPGQETPEAPKTGEKEVPKKPAEEKEIQLPEETEEFLLKLLSESKFQDAAESAKEALKTAPKSPVANYVLGKSLFSTEGANVRDAIDALRLACIASNWKNADYIKALADAYEKDGRIDFAVAALEKAVEAAPEDAALRARLEELKKKLQPESSAEQVPVPGPGKTTIRRGTIIIEPPAPPKK